MREYLLTLCVAAAVTFVLTAPVRKFAVLIGAMPQIRARDVHREPTPRLGGVAMFGGLCAGLLVAGQLTNVREVFAMTSEPLALLSGASVVALIGALDDKWGLSALLKLGGQVIAAGVMVLQGLTVLWLPIPGVGPVPLTEEQGMFVTVTVVVVTINAVNFADGLDGLASGLVCIAAAAFFLHAYRMWYGYGIEGAAPATLFAALLIGMCLGFLPHNIHPARIFMGDSGSMLLALVLAASAVSVTGQVDSDLLVERAGSSREATHAMMPVYIPLLLPLTVLALPVADLLLSVVRRVWKGRSPFAADRGHLHHRMLDIGHSHRRAVFVLCFWAALFAFGTIALSVHDGSVWVAAGIILFALVGLVLLLLPRLAPNRARRPGSSGSAPPARETQEREQAHEREPGELSGTADGGPRQR